MDRSRGETERKLRDADAHLRALVDHSTSAIYLKDKQRRYLLVNRRHMDLFPQMRRFRPGMTPEDFFSPELAQSFTRSDDAVWRSGEQFTFEESIPLEDGVHVYLSNKFPVCDETGAIIAVGGISTDITEVKRARESIARKEDLLRRLIDIQETEKQRLCHEFHDGLIQYAVAAKMQLESIDRGLLPPGCVAAIDTACEHLSRGLEDGRRVIRGIRPAALDDLGLAAALEELCIQPRSTGPTISTQIDPEVDQIPAALQTAVYRVVQESLSNACRHSNAHQASVAVRRDGGEVEVVVSDTGRGFDPRLVGRGGFGLIGLEERVRLAGGKFLVESVPGGGTRLMARLPVPEPHHTTATAPGAPRPD